MIQDAARRCRATLKPVRRWLAVWVVAATALPAAAAEPARVGELETVYTAGGGVPLALQKAGTGGVYLAADPEWGLELWATDGTAGGTHPLRSLCRGSGCSLAAWGSTGAIAFIAIADGDEVRLWRSDGSPEGTLPLTPSLRGPGGGSIEASLTIAGPFAYLALTGSEWSAVWSSDGTVAGTRALLELPMWFVASSALGEDFFWVVGAQLWRGSARDGVVELLQELDGDVEAMVGAGDRLFFFVGSDWTRTLWTSDGSAPGTRALRRFPTSGGYTEVGLLVSLAGRAWFVADGRDGEELWSSDGTAAGTRPATAFRRRHPFGQDPWSEHLLAGMLAQVGSRVVFPAGPYEALRLWTTNGHARQARPLEGCAGGCPYVAPYGLVARGGRAAFLGWREGECLALWITDGSPAGTVRLAGLGAEHAALNAAGGLWFAAIDWGVAWVSDGTPGGTRRMAVAPGSDLLALGSAVLFTGTSDTDILGLWRTDGRSEAEVLPPQPRAVSTLVEIAATAGERVVLRDGWELFWGADAADLQRLPREDTGSVGVCGADSVDGAAAGERAYFLVSWKCTLTAGKHFWSTDGTATGTAPLQLEEAHVTGLPVTLPGTTGEAAYFEPSTTGPGRLVRTDGTAAGTRELLALPPGGSSHLVAAGGQLVWVMTDASGATLWRLDPVTGESGPISPPVARRLQPPVALDGVVYALGEAQEEGAPVLVAAAVGAAPRVLALDQRGVASAQMLTAAGGRLWFRGEAAGDTAARQWLWTTDGTLAGTVRLPVELSLASLTVSYRAADDMSPVSGPGGAVYFVGLDAAGERELWRSDGTVAGTSRVLDLQPGLGSGGPTGRPVSWQSRLFFPADDGIHGVELWSTDGTAGGTRLEAELQPGPLGSFPTDLTVAGDHLFFTAEDDERGRQLYVLTPTP